MSCSLSGNRALDTVSWQVVHRPRVLRARQFFFYDFYVKSSSHYSPVRILSTSPDPTVFYDFYVKSSSRYRYSPVGHFPQSSRKTAETKTLLRRPAATFTRTNGRFRARECFQDFQAWIHAFPISHASQLLLSWWCGCHDECGDDCGCHHGEKASHDNWS